jgi:hypothetical protein
MGGGERPSNPPRRPYRRTPEPPRATAPTSPAPPRASISTVIPPQGAGARPCSTLPRPTPAHGGRVRGALNSNVKAPVPYLRTAPCGRPDLPRASPSAAPIYSPPPPGAGARPPPHPAPPDHGTGRGGERPSNPPRRPRRRHPGPPRAAAPTSPAPPREPSQPLRPPPRARVPIPAPPRPARHGPVGGGSKLHFAPKGGGYYPGPGRAGHVAPMPTIIT